jgi:hypothetical protein
VDNNIEVRFKLGRYFAHQGYKVAISVPELKAQTNDFSVKNQGGCAPALEKSNPKDLYLQYNVKCKLNTSDPAGHEVKVHFDLSQVKDETTARNLDVAASCTCPAFLYWGAQWNMHQRDALEGEPRPLLTAPTERLDLRGKFVICKHCKVVFDRILPSVQHNIVKVLRQRDVEERKQKPRTPKPQLDERQEKMRQRQEKKQVMQDKNKTVQDELAEAVRNRETMPPPAPVVTRDEPATPEEKVRVEQEQPLPEIPEIDEQELEPVEEPKKPEPQQMPTFDDDDQDAMNQLMDEDEEES